MTNAVWCGLCGAAAEMIDEAPPGESGDVKLCSLRCDLLDMGPGTFAEERRKLDGGALVVDTRAAGCRWTPAVVPNETLPVHTSFLDAQRRVSALHALDDPMWQTARFRIRRATARERAAATRRA